MAAWGEFEMADPELAAAVRAAFDSGVHKTMATIRADGGPRISGTELEFADGQVYIGTGEGARKTRDLLRDPRVAIHSPTHDPDPTGGWVGEAKFTGTAASAAPPAGYPPGALRFRIDLTSVVFTGLTPDNAQLHIRLWRPGRGREEMYRT